MSEGTTGSPANGESCENLLEATVNEVTQKHPETLQVFHRHGLDCCCGGVRPVGEAARRHGVDPEALVRDLEAVTTR